MKIHKYVILLCIIMSTLLTSCTDNPILIKKTTINNLEDACPNDNMTYCEYVVTSPAAEVNITLTTENNTELNISVTQQ